MALQIAVATTSICRELRCITRNLGLAANQDAGDFRLPLVLGINVRRSPMRHQLLGTRPSEKAVERAEISNARPLQAARKGCAPAAEDRVDECVGAEARCAPSGRQASGQGSGTEVECECS